MSLIDTTLLTKSVKKATNDKEKTNLPNSACTLLHLPVNLVLLISDRLPLQNQLVLAQTCRPLKRILDHRLRDVSAKTKRSQHTEYLVLVARDLPDQWVCALCKKLHRVDNMFDTPANPQDVTCSKHEGQTPVNYEYFGYRPFTLHHRHHQLTLKYARLGDQKYQPYLDRLLKPYNVRFARQYCFGEETREVEAGLSSVGGQHSVHPKVVSGRYLLQSTWIYEKEGFEVLREAIPPRFICRHQLFMGSPPDVGTHLEKFPVRPPHPHDVLRLAFFQALNLSIGEEIHGFCSLCPTDFSIQVSLQRAVVRAWQDFGGEGSPLDLAWRALKGSHHLETLGHVPGSVRERFNS